MGDDTSSVEKLYFAAGPEAKGLYRPMSSPLRGLYMIQTVPDVTSA